MPRVREKRDKTIRATICMTATLNTLWYDDPWYDEMRAEGKNHEEALKEMLMAGFEEDGSSLLWEFISGQSQERPTAEQFGKHIIGVCRVYV